MIRNERNRKRGWNEQILPYCQKEIPRSRLPDLKRHLLPLLVVILFVTPLMIILGNDAPGGVFDPEPEPVGRSTAETGVDEFISNEDIRTFVHTTDGGYAVLLTTRFDITEDNDVMLVKLTSNGTIQWSQTYGRTVYDRAGDLVHTSDGGFALVGSSYAWTPEENDEENYDTWLLKLDGEGRMEWNTTHRIVISPGMGAPRISSMVQTEDGGFAIVHTNRLFLKLSNTGSLEWSKTYVSLNPTDYDEFGRVKPFFIHDLVQTADGGFAFTGINGHAGTWGPERDMVLIKTNSNGTFEWNRTYGELEGPAAAYSLIQTEDGGFALYGESGDGSFGAQFGRATLVKTDDRGNLEWKRDWGDVWPGGSLIQTADGGYILLGSKETLLKESLACMIKIDSQGTFEWDHTFKHSPLYVKTRNTGHIPSNTATHIVVTADGFTLAGTSIVAVLPFPFVIEQNSGGPADVDAWVIHIDVDGNEKWKTVLDGTGDEEAATDLLQTTDGGFLLTGFAGYHNNGKMDAFLLKTDEMGVPIWNQTYGGLNDDIPEAVIQTSEGGYLFAGYSGSFSDDNSDAWLVKTDPNGLVEWNQTYGGPANDGAEAVIQTVDGGYVLAGYSRSFSDDNSDAWLVKTDPNGLVEWNKTYGGSGNDRALELFQLANGHLVLLGYYGQELIYQKSLNHLPSEAKTSALFDDAWVLIVNETGHILNEEVFECSGRIRFHAIRPIEAGLIVVGVSRREAHWAYGWDISIDNDSLSGDNTVVFLQITETEVSIWDQAIPYQLLTTDLVITKDEGVLLVGMTYNSDPSDPCLHLIKMDGQGNSQWEVNLPVERQYLPQIYGFHGPRRDVPNTLVPTIDGGCALGTGVLSHSFAGESLDVWLLRFSENGTLQWDYSYGAEAEITNPNIHLVHFPQESAPIAAATQLDGLSVITGLGGCFGVSFVIRRKRGKNRLV